MDKFIYLFNNQLLSDLTLLLVDANIVIELPVHKCILHANCPYFKGMFDGRYCSDSKQVVTVSNSQMAQDIIASFYGIELPVEGYNFQQMLDLYICRDFFGLEFQSYKKFVVPVEHYNDLIKVIDTIGYNDETMRILVDNLSIEYDLTNLSIDLLKIFMQNIVGYRIIYKSGSYIFIKNLLSGVSEALYYGTYQSEFLYVKEKNWLIVTGQNILTIINLDNNCEKEIYCKKYDNSIKNIFYSIKQDQLYIIFSDDNYERNGHFDNTLIIIDTNNFETVKKHQVPCLKYQSMSTNGKYLVGSANQFKIVYVGDYDSTINFRIDMNNIFFTATSDLIYSIGKIIYIYYPQHKIHRIIEINSVITHLKPLQDNLIVTVDTDCVVTVCNYKTNEFINSFKVDIDISDMFILNQNQILLLGKNQSKIYEAFAGLILNEFDYIIDPSSHLEIIPCHNLNLADKIRCEYINLIHKSNT